MPDETKIAPSQADGPVFIIREASKGDHRQLLELARELDSINLPTDSRELREAIACSMLSFRGRVRDHARARYIFCAEERRSGAIVAASMLIAKHGTPEAPHYYLEMDSDDRYSHTLRKMFRHPYLRLRYSMDGPTEIGGLIVTNSMRRHPDRVGKQISWVRFLYLAKHPGRFERQVVAEMLAPMLPDHGNVFWDHYGRRMTGLSFREADILSTRDKEFIRALFPDTPLYTFLLPEGVSNSLGAIGEATHGAVRLLEQAGMRFLRHIDPFDGGPYYGAEIAELRPVREWRSVAAIAGEPTADRARAYLVGCEDARGFRAVRAQAEMVDPGKIKVEPAALAALGVTPRTRVDAVPLP
jgi:arginine N-succinyltransferase